MAFAVVFPFLRMANLKEIFYDVYHNPETCSAARRVLTFGVLENVFNEFRTLPLVNMDTTNYQSYAIISRRQTEVALSQLAIFLPASYENIMALVLGAAQAVEMCKPSLCWIMISSAAGLCQSLGYVSNHVQNACETTADVLHLASNQHYDRRQSRRQTDEDPYLLDDLHA